jgi:hypothetical protein
VAGSTQREDAVRQSLGMFAAMISTRGITYGFWITKALCRTPRRISRSSSTELPLNLFFMYRSRNDSRVPA